MPDGPKVALIVLAILVPVVLLGIFMYERRHGGRRHHGRDAERLPLFGTGKLAIVTPHGLEMEEPGDSSSSTPPARPRQSEPRTPPVQRSASSPPSRNGASAMPEPSRRDFAPPAAAHAQYAPPAPRPSVRPPANAFGSAPTIEHPSADHTPTASKPVGNGGAADLALIEGETLRFVVPAEGTVEFLPGHLEIVAGPEAGREIRFARAPGETDTEVTFGRSEGPPNRHIQILARTVSRRHAAMTLIEDHWQLSNLSTTNPVVLNGRVLGPGEVVPLLVEGDRIEMGEVVFVFHEA
jgi:FHA domain